MPSIPPSSTDCAPCDGASSSCITGSVPIPGVPGSPGAPGTNGVSAYTLLTASFVVPAPAANVTVAVGSTAWMVSGQIVFIQSAGSYQVASVTDLTDAVLTCLNYAGDAAAGTTIAIGQKIVPAGLRGPSGAMGGGVTSVALSVPSILTVTGSPVTTTGTLGITFAGAQTQDRVLATPDGAAGPVALIALAPGHIPNLPATVITSGQIPLARGGTGQNGATAAFNALAPTTTKGDTIVFQGGGGANVRLAIGMDGQALVADSTQTNGLKWGTPAVSVELIQNAAPVTGGNVVFATSSENITLYLAPAGTLATLSISLPSDANSFIGQICRVFTSQTLTALTVSVPSGTITGTAVTALAQFASLVFQKAASNAWIRLS